MMCQFARWRNGLEPEQIPEDCIMLAAVSRVHTLGFVRPRVALCIEGGRVAELIDFDPGGPGHGSSVELLRTGMMRDDLSAWVGEADGEHRLVSLPRDITPEGMRWLRPALALARGDQAAGQAGQVQNPS